MASPSDDNTADSEIDGAVSSIYGRACTLDSLYMVFTALFNPSMQKYRYDIAKKQNNRQIPPKEPAGCKKYIYDPDTVY